MEKRNILVFVLLSVVLLWACSPEAAPQPAPPEVPVTPSPAEPVSEAPEEEVSPPESVAASEAAPSPQVQEFTVTARQFEFIPDEIRVKQGDSVKLLLTSQDVMHGFNLPAFGINERLPPGQTVEVNFVADKAGEFPFACSIPCGSGHGGMRGKLVVE